MVKGWRFYFDFRSPFTFMDSDLKLTLKFKIKSLTRHPQKKDGILYILHFSDNAFGLKI